MASKKEQTLNIRAAARYLQDKGVDVGEMRMRSLIRQHDAFTKLQTEGDPQSAGAFKSKLPNSEIETWEIRPSALDRYIAAVQSGATRNAGNGKKFYRIQLDAAQFEELRKWAEARGIPAPDRANKNQGNSKGKAAKASANGKQATETLEGLLQDMDEPAPVLEH